MPGGISVWHILVFLLIVAAIVYLWKRRRG